MVVAVVVVVSSPDREIRHKSKNGPTELQELTGIQQLTVHRELKPTDDDCSHDRWGKEFHRSGIELSLIPSLLG